MYHRQCNQKYPITFCRVLSYNSSVANTFILQDFQKSKAFLYLSEIQRRFLAVYGQDAQTAVPYAMNTDFARTLASTMVKSINLFHFIFLCFHVYFLFRNITANPIKKSIR